MHVAGQRLPSEAARFELLGGVEERPDHLERASKGDFGLVER